MARETDEIWKLAEPIAGELGLEVLDVELAGSASTRRLLRIYLDNPAPDRGVSLADCETVSRRMGDALDAHDALPGSYMLEVSSPGLNRPLLIPPGGFERPGGEQHIATRGNLVRQKPLQFGQIRHA